MVNKNIVLLSYGNKSEYLRAIFCILSISSWVLTKSSDTSSRSIKIIVYTDNPDYFKKHLGIYEIEYYLLTPSLMQEMLANTNYIHRRKVFVIDLTFKQYPKSDLIFIDTDTFFYAPPGPLMEEFSNEKSFMHQREYQLTDAVARFSSFNQGQFPTAFLKYIKNRKFVIRNTEELFSGKDYCWNSGVLGLSSEFASYLPDIFKLTDEFYKHSGWFISEQLAFGLTLQRKTKVQATDGFIAHYWGKRQKLLLDSLISELLQEKTAAELIDSIHIRMITVKWKDDIINDLILEQAVISLQQNYWLYGFKKALQVILKDPFNSGMYRQLFAAAVA
jgi:hypothetical protein